jgi:hypothetical protein
MGSITELPPAPSRAAPVTFSDLADAFIAAMPTMVQQINAVEDEFEAAVAAPAWSGTSTTSLSIGTGSKTLTIQAGKSINIGMSVKIANSNDGTQWMFGDVTAYNSGTGSLTVNVTHTNGSGTIATWTVTMSGPEGPNYVRLGTEASVTPFAYLILIDTATGLIKQRNAANNAWITLGSAVTAFMGLLSLATAQTITAVHTFDPGSATAPFLLHANAQGQAITGLNADQIDGKHYSDLVAAFAALAGLSTQTFQAADGASGKQVVNISQFGKAVETNGYQKLPGGFTIEWGVTTVNSGSYTDVTFPLAFSTIAYGVMTTPNQTGTDDHFTAKAGSLSTTGVRITNTDTSDMDVYWIAIGY